eukprot:54861_1
MSTTWFILKEDQLIDLTPSLSSNIEAAYLGKKKCFFGMNCYVKFNHQTQIHTISTTYEHGPQKLIRVTKKPSINKIKSEITGMGYRIGTVEAAIGKLPNDLQNNIPAIIAQIHDFPFTCNHMKNAINEILPPNANNINKNINNNINNNNNQNIMAFQQYQNGIN